MSVHTVYVQRKEKTLSSYERGGGRCLLRSYSKQKRAHTECFSSFLRAIPNNNTVQYLDLVVVEGRNVKRPAAVVCLTHL